MAPPRGSGLCPAGRMAMIGKVASTRYRRPLVLVAYQEFENVKKAAEYEKKYKKSSGHLQRMLKSGKFIVRDN